MALAPDPECEDTDWADVSGAQASDAATVRSERQKAARDAERIDGILELYD